MQRRDFITLLGGAAAWPLAVRAQQSAMPVIGFLGTGTPSSWSRWTPAFVNRLRELGWIEGRTVRIEYRWAEGRDDLYAEIAAELVRLKVDVIVTQGTAAVLAAKQATSVIPIVFASAGDPVGNGLVETLARPKGNVTGLSSQATENAPKRLELLRELIPTLRTLAFISNSVNLSSMREIVELQAAARILSLEIAVSDIRRTEDIAPALDAIKGRAEALFLFSDPLLIANRVRIATFGTEHVSADDGRLAGIRRSGMSDVLRIEHPGTVPARRRFCRQNFTRGEAWRYSGRAADQIRIGHQSQDR